MRVMLNNFYKKPNLINFTKIIFIFLFLLNLYNIVFSLKIFLLLNLVLLVHYISIFYFLKNENNKYFAILPLIITFFFITYTLSFLIGNKDFFLLSFDEMVLQKSIFILVLGLSSLLFGYIIVDKFFKRREKKIFYFNFSKQQQILILVVCSIVTFLVYYNNTCFSFVYFSFLKLIKEPQILFNF